MKLLRGFWAAPLAAGGLMLASFPPLDLGFLMPLAWTVLLLSMRVRRGERAGRQALVAFLVLFLAGVWWIGPLVWPLWPVVALWCAAWEALWARYVVARVVRSERPHPAWIVLLPASHLLADMLRTTVLTGFPWFLTGYSGWRNRVLLGSADLIGVHGATFAILVLAAGLAEFLHRRAGRESSAARALVPAALVWAGLAVWTYGKPALEERPGPTLLLLQPNIPQELKEKGTGEDTSPVFWKEHEDLAAEAFASRRPGEPPIDVVVWAETMMPSLALRPLREGDELLTYVEDGRWPDGRPRFKLATSETRRVTAASRGAQTLVGVQSVAEGGRRGLFFNTVVLLDREGRIRGHQDKQHLTPGGEYIPLRSLIPFRESFEAYLENAIGFLPDLQPGERGFVLPLARGADTGVLICYESVYPEVPRRMVRDGATMIVNCSNYGWFAGSSQMPQALAMCAFRAAELRRSVVLSSNNGISAVLGPDGTQRGPATQADTRGFVVAPVPLCESRSPFVLVGEWAAWALGALAAAAVRLLPLGARPSAVAEPPLA